MNYRNYLPARQSIVVENQAHVVKERDIRHTMKSVAATTEKVEEHKERYRMETEQGTESKKFGRRNYKGKGGK